MELRKKLEILADAAKYDASCASSGGPRRKAGPGGVGSTDGTGICHSYTPDGRCVSLLKVLLTNYCIYDCAYCINRRSSNVERARFRVSEVVELTLAFYRRNYIEGLFLSSGIIRDADHTMSELVAVARTLRQEHGFAGYIHLKTIPEASPELIDEAARWADRLSINVELPSQPDLDALAPGKRLVQIEGAMGRIRSGIEDGVERRRRYAPAGQSTQMVVGATSASDHAVLSRAASLYRDHALKRVYYSGYSPIPDATASLPASAPPLVREHRLYQADWLLRFYGYDVGELFDDGAANLSLQLDPKLAYALRHREQFPLDVNTAAQEQLLRVPGLGVSMVQRVLSTRRHRRLGTDDLRRMRVSRRALHFLRTAETNPLVRSLDSLRLEHVLAPARQQLDLFATAHAARTGEL